MSRWLASDAAGFEWTVSAHGHPRVAEHPQPRRILRPVVRRPAVVGGARGALGVRHEDGGAAVFAGQAGDGVGRAVRSEEHTSELQSLMRISYAVFCLKKKITNKIRYA